MVERVGQFAVSGLFRLSGGLFVEFEKGPRGQR